MNFDSSSVYIYQALIDLPTHRLQKAVNSVASFLNRVSLSFYKQIYAS